MKIEKAVIDFLEKTGNKPCIEISSDLDLKHHLEVVYSLYYLALKGIEVNYKFNNLMKKNTYIIKELIIE